MLTVAQFRKLLKGVQRATIVFAPKPGRESWSDEQIVEICMSLSPNVRTSVETVGWAAVPKSRQRQHSAYLYCELDRLRDLLALVKGTLEIRFRYMDEADDMPDRLLADRGLVSSSVCLELWDSEKKGCVLRIPIVHDFATIEKSQTLHA